MPFSNDYKPYIETAAKTTDSDFSLDTVAKIEPVLSFLFENWWKVELTGLQHIYDKGPVLFVGNAGGVMPWAGLMLMYALMKDKSHPRRLNILADLSWIEDERLYSFLREVGFVPFSADNVKRILSEGESAIVFPEGIAGAVKPFGERYRLRLFDWTQLMPAIEMNIPLIPVATLGPDESFPVGKNLDKVAKMLSLPAFPITPFFPFMPFPVNLFSLPLKWKMRVMRPVDYSETHSREEVEQTSKNMALFMEGEVQAELNRLLRVRIKPLF